MEKLKSYRDAAKASKQPSKRERKAILYILRILPCYKKTHPLSFELPRKKQQ